MQITTSRSFALAAAASLAATPAFAHTGAGDAHGFIHGLAHPIGGMDHVLAMVAVGLFASLLGGRALWAVPLAFVGMMLVGGAFGMAGVELPAVELGITASIIAIGAVTAFGGSLPLAAAMALVGFFAIFHGHAHGAEMPLGAGAFAYSAGFAFGTALLHALGLGIGLAVRSARVVRMAGAATAVVGAVLLVA
jgi:urease accessory protein